jgi:hypothetical protein
MQGRAYPQLELESMSERLRALMFLVMMVIETLIA